MGIMITLVNRTREWSNLEMYDLTGAGVSDDYLGIKPYIKNDWEKIKLVLKRGKQNVKIKQ